MKTKSKVDGNLRVIGIPMADRTPIHSHKLLDSFGVVINVLEFQGVVEKVVEKVFDIVFWGDVWLVVGTPFGLMCEQSIRTSVSLHWKTRIEN